MTIKNSFLRATFFFLFSLLFSACNSEIAAVPTPTLAATPTVLAFVTATLPATATPLPTATLAPTVTPAPVFGQATAQLNIRRAPLPDSEQIGTVDAFAEVQIVGRNQDGGWWMIVLPEGASQRGWVSAQFVQVDNPAGVPVVSTEVGTGNVPTPAASAVSSSAAGSLPTAAPTSALAVALPDGDAADNPAVNITLSENSVPYLVYKNDLSLPDGDTEDWVRFALEGSVGQEKIVSLVTNCQGTGRIGLDLMQNGVVLQKWTELTCNQRHQVQLYLYVSAPYTLHIYPVAAYTDFQYCDYALEVQLMK